MATDRLLALLWLSTVLANGYSKDQCEVGSSSDVATVPKGGLDVDYIEVLLQGNAHHANVPVEYCLSLCCELGLDRCQYVWIIWNSCFAVACKPGSNNICQPVPLQSSSLYSSYSLDIPSVYVEVIFKETPTISLVSPTSERSQNTFRSSMDNTIKTTKVDTDGGGIGREKSISDKDAGKGGSELVDTGKTVSDADPVAHAGDDVLVVLPKTTALLYGNHSTDDKGIVYYLWQLTAEDHRSNARVLDFSSSVARVVDLSPGTYTITLTVVDASLQSSSDSILVTVLAGSHDPPWSTTPTKSSHETWKTNSTLMGVAEAQGSPFSKKAILLKVLVPVLVMLLVISLVSALLVVLSVCVYDRRKKNRHLYRYRNLHGRTTAHDT